MAEKVLLVDLGIDATNDDIVEQMRIMKRAREQGFYEFIVCCIRGFDGDPRELRDIPEVRAFCRRIVNLGFISYLDFITSLGGDLPELVKYGWGATEVWLCSEGRLKAQFALTTEGVDEITAAIAISNEKADATLGPMNLA